MWIKTCKDHVINVDHLSVIFYDEKDDYTVGYIGEDMVVIGRGNCIENIGAALQRGSNYIEVKRYDR